MVESLWATTKVVLLAHISSKDLSMFLSVCVSRADVAWPSERNLVMIT